VVPFGLASVRTRSALNGPHWSIEVAVNPLVELALEVAPLGAGKHPLAEAGSTGQHSANICGRMGLGDIQAGRLRRRSTKVQQEVKR
jgi:hypothetical protein